jgi:hypothetical protein
MKKNAFALPIILLFFVVFSMMAIGIGVKFRNLSRQSTADQLFNKRYGGAYTGTEWAKYHMVRPDDPAQAIHWTSGQSNTFTMTINGEKVTVTIDHIIEGS